MFNAKIEIFFGKYKTFEIGIKIAFFWFIGWHNFCFA